jgi:hypothetical protein
MQRVCSLVLAIVFSAPTALAQGPRKAGPPSASVNSMLAYQLTAAGLDKYAEASKAMNALIAKEPGVLAKLKPSATDAPNSIDATVAFTRQHCPECVSTVEKTMPYREYVLFQGSLLIAYVSAIRPRTGTKVHVSPENLKFVLGNRAKIDGILAEQRKQPGIQ